MAERFLTPEALAIANGTGAAELCCEMIRVLRDRIAGHVSIVERSDPVDYFAYISGHGLLETAEAFLVKATVYAGSAVETEREVRNADATSH